MTNCGRRTQLPNAVPRRLFECDNWCSFQRWNSSGAHNSPLAEWFAERGESLDQHSDVFVDAGYRLSLSNPNQPKLGKLGTRINRSIDNCYSTTPVIPDAHIPGEAAA